MSLHKKLRDKQPVLAQMYGGALRILDQSDNPDRLALAAHDIRELMEKFPIYADIRIRPPDSLGSKVNNLKQYWENARSSFGCQRGSWNGSIHRKIVELRCQLDEFFDWHDKNLPSRTNQIIKTLREIDSTGRPIPSALERINAKNWQQMHAYFLGVAHHGKNTTDSEFTGYLGALEQFLIERIEPRTFDQHEEIDSIIAKH